MRTDLACDARGAVQLEFLLAFVPLFVLFVGLVQLVLLQVAQLVVQHAATRGARSAIVILNDDPDRYAGAAIGEIGGERGSPPTERQQAIRRATGVPLLALAPASARGLGRRATPPSVGGALRSGVLAAVVAGATEPLHASTEVEFPIAPGSARLHRGRVPVRGDIHLRVRHRYPCLVPIARELLCDTPAGRPLGPRRAFEIVAEASMPSHWASYAEAPDAAP